MTDQREVGWYRYNGQMTRPDDRARWNVFNAGGRAVTRGAELKGEVDIAEAMQNKSIYLYVLVYGDLLYCNNSEFMCTIILNTQLAPYRTGLFDTNIAWLRHSFYIVTAIMNEICSW